MKTIILLYMMDKEINKTLAHIGLAGNVLSDDLVFLQY